MRSLTVAIMDGTGIRIRSAAASEYPAIGELTHAAYTHDYADLPAHYQEELKHPEALVDHFEFFVAEEDATGELLGTIALLRVGHDNHGHIGPDELYFRLLPPAWGYTDQPPFTPLVAHLMTAVADEPWALRIPAALVAALSAIVVGLIAAEVGGGRDAQALAAWGAGFGYYPLLLGHVLFTATFDLLVWPLILLCVLRAVLRRRGSWFLVAGLVAGVSLYNKLLVLALLLSVAVGLAVAGPRRASVWGWATAGSLLVVVIGAPNLVYQLVHGLPQLQVGAALTAQNAADVRPFVLPFLLVLLGPFLVPMWVAGLVAPWLNTQVVAAHPSCHQ